MEPRRYIGYVWGSGSSAAQLVEPFQITDWPGFLDILNKRGPRQLIHQIREAEASDPHAERWPATSPKTTPPSPTSPTTTTDSSLPGLHSIYMSNPNSTQTRRFAKSSSRSYSSSKACLSSPEGA
jgi:hypothetical protein